MLLMVGLLPLLQNGLLHAETRHIHVLWMLDSENQDYVIREGCRSIKLGLEQEVLLMQRELGVDRIWDYDISGANFSLARLDQVLEYELEYQERDIVILLYVGHGFRDESTSGALPKLYFNSYTESVALAELQERILDKKPSLLLTVAVACNVTVQNWGVPPPYLPVNDAPDVVSLAPRADRADRAEAYRALFGEEENYTKCVDLVSAGEEFYTFISADGGIFFNSFLYALREAVSGRAYPGWENVCQAITTQTVERSGRKGLRQQPFCRYYVRINPVEVNVPAQAGFTWRRSPCETQAREIRRNQRQELRDLRRMHRTAVQNARRQNMPAPDRRLLLQQQAVEVEQAKLRHQKDYVRHLQQCR